MPRHLLFLLVGGGLLLGAVPAGRALSQTRSAPDNSTRTGTRPPNFIVILGEGHGWSSLSVPMDPASPDAVNRDVPLKNFARLANNGMRFTRFYVAAPRCTPSRAALLTGKSPARLHMTFVNEGRRDNNSGSTKLLPPQTITELPDSEKTVANLLQTAGYATAHFGKWHVGRVDPTRHGFTVSDGPNNNGGPDNVADPSRVQTPRTAGLAVGFVTAQAKAGKPFYLQLDQYASRDESAQEDMDKALGQLMQTVADWHIAGNTYFLYTTDHGSPGRNLPLSGGKGLLLEGGIRVPLLISGPNIAPNSISRVPATEMDLLPTIANLAGIPALTAEREGGSLIPLLRAGGSGVVRRAREPLFFHYPHYDHDNGGPASAIMLGDWKLIRYYETNTVQLYDVVKDPAERRDLREEQPKITADLDKRLSDYLHAVGAQQATVNAAYHYGFSEKTK